MPLGQLLTQNQTITGSQLSEALHKQQQQGGRLGDILVAEGMVGYHKLYLALAEHYGLPFANLIKEPPQPALLNQADAETYLRLRAIPWRRQDGKIIVATAEPTDELKQWAKTEFGDVALAITSPYDIRRTTEIFCKAPLEEASRFSLWQKRPELSARITFTRTQKTILSLFMAATCFGAIFSPLATALAIIIACHLAYSATMLFKCIIFAAGAHGHMPTDSKALSALDEKSLPVYTILIPMYKEAASLPGMLACMRTLDYPAAKLDIKLVLEADDHETYAAACALRPHYHFDIIRVPPSQPRTKPKACNYALRFARGELVTVFDADDHPDPQQLKKAVLAFRNADEKLGCVQARLNYYNAQDNLLTRFFALEYMILFNVTLWGLERMGIPIPLGGTSNHMSLSRLREVGEWDPYNVTEDADLGTRLAALGLHTTMIDSDTMEEAPNQIGAWIRQRSRWIKGYMQTWLVHMRKPGQLYQALGAKAFIGFQFFIGLSCFTFLSAPIVWSLTLVWATGALETFPRWLAMLTAFNLVLNVATHWVSAFYCALRFKKRSLPMLVACLLYPLYMILHSLASYRALWQLVVNAHFWDKTTHGVTRQKIAPKAAIRG